jgi:fatty-acyl-CoA synthase
MGMTINGLSHWQAESEGIELLDTTIGDLLDQRADELPTQEAIVYTCYPEFGGALNIRWTYQEYRERVNAVAKGLLTLGLKKGDHIAVWATNQPEWILLMMAAAKAGLVLVTINPLLRASEVAFILKQSDARVLFFMARIRDHDCLATIRSMTIPDARNGEVTSNDLPMLRCICLIGIPPTGLLEQANWRPSVLSEVSSAGTKISDASVYQQQMSISPLDPVMIQYTSGTTGFPKGAILTHHGLLNNALLLGRRQGFDQNLRACVPVPFFHTFGCVGYILGALCVSGTCHPLLAFDPLKTLQIISSEHCTTVGAVPTMLLNILQHSDLKKYDLSSLRTVLSGGSLVPVYLMEQVKERLGADVAIALGQTEASGAITMTLPDDPFERRAATVGVPLPHTEVKIVHTATGEPVPCSERGELCYRGYQVMAGYYQIPKKTAEVIDSEGWLHSGDLATMNAQGYLNIVGRLKDMVIRGGENLFPREIEEFLIRHPKVADVQVVGVPDIVFGEELLAVVIPKDGEQLTEQELRQYCRGQISYQKIPRHFQFVTSYPLTASGKVQKFVLREQAIKALRLEEVAKTKTA